MQHFSIAELQKPIAQRRSLISRFFQAKRLDDLKPEIPTRASFIASTTTSGFKIQNINLEELIQQLPHKQQLAHEHLIHKVLEHEKQIDNLLHFITSQDFMSSHATQEFTRRLKV